MSCSPKKKFVHYRGAEEWGLSSIQLLPSIWTVKSMPLWRVIGCGKLCGAKTKFLKRSSRNEVTWKKFKLRKKFGGLAGVEAKPDLKFAVDDYVKAAGSVRRIEIRNWGWFSLNHAMKKVLTNFPRESLPREKENSPRKNSTPVQIALDCSLQR